MPLCGYALAMISLPASLDRNSAVGLFEDVVGLLAGGATRVELDAGQVRHIDAFGAAAILEAHGAASQAGAEFRLRNVSSQTREVLALLRVDRVLSTSREVPAKEPLLARIGGWGFALTHSAVQQAALNVDGLFLTFIAPFRRKGPRVVQFIRQLNLIGTQATGIVVLISFLIGLIMALQSASQLRQFGANIYVADLVGISMTRELGPLLTAIIVAARSGSSIAAELGTMVVTEEVDALRVMGLNPRRFLVAPRFAAMVLALPCLAILADLAGITGGFVVGVFGLDIGANHYWNQTITALYTSDILSGLVKSFVFANVIAVVACHCGLSLTGGPEQVGRATTRAVVSSIIIVILADFFFTSIFYLLT